MTELSDHALPAFNGAVAWLRAWYGALSTVPRFLLRRRRESAYRRSC